MPASAHLPERIAWALGELSPRQGQVVVLHYYGDLPVGAISRRLGRRHGHR